MGRDRKNFKDMMSYFQEYEEYQQNSIDYYRNRVHELEDAHYKDGKIKKLEEQLNSAVKELAKSYHIPAEAEEQFKEWRARHTEEKHNVSRNDIKGILKLEGAVGGRWSYNFVPTSIGTIISCRCDSCYEKALGNWYKGEWFLKTFEDKIKYLEEKDVESTWSDL